MSWQKPATSTFDVLQDGNINSSRITEYVTIVQKKPQFGKCIQDNKVTLKLLPVQNINSNCNTNIRSLIFFIMFMY